MRSPLLVAACAAATALAGCGTEQPTAVAPASGPFPSPAGVTVPAGPYHRVDLPFGAFGGTVTGVNDSRVAVGYVAVTSATRAARWAAGTHEHEHELLPPLAEGANAQAFAIADDGTIVGMAIDARSVQHPVMWRDGRITPLDTAPGFAIGMCPCDGTVAIGTITGDTLQRAVFSVSGRRVDVGAPAGMSRASLAALAHGHVVGTALNPRFVHGGFSTFAYR